jgi:hypothetical protein
MCWGKLPRHPGRAHAWPLCGPWPRPHLAAAKLVDLRSSVDLVAMPHQPLDRPVASLTNPGLRDVRYAHIAPPRAVLGSPRCGWRGERQRAGDTTPELTWGRCSFGGWPLRPALAPLARLAQPVARRSFRLGIIALTKLPRYPGRAHAWPLCGPWPRPHLAAAKLVDLRSSVNLVAMPHQPLDRPVASLTNPGLRDVRYAHIAPPRAILGSPRCGCRGER